jgi:pSer/pThr/pTyr-binding forkhead associated (FHA) protein
MSNVPLLVGVSGKLQGERYAIPPQGLRVGRQAGNEVLLDDTGVSRQHARLIFHNGALWVQDMGSRNGVFVNEVRVQAHRQLSPGDKIRIGNTVFEVRIDDPAYDQSVSVAAQGGGPPAPPRRGLRLMPLIIVAIIVIVLVALVAVVGSRKIRIAEPSADDGTASLLASTMDGLEDQAQGGSAQEDPGSAPIEVSADATLHSLLEGDQQQPTTTAAFGTSSDIQDEWPDPPPGMSSRELVEKAHGLYNAGRLHDALVAYHQAQMLDAACEICARRIDRLNTEITEKISEYFDAGLRYYDDMQFQQAVSAWEMVLLLAPNPSSRSHQQAKQYLEKAQAQLSRQY